MIVGQINETLFSILGHGVTTLHLGKLALSWIVSFSLYYIVVTYLLPILFAREDENADQRRMITRWFRWILLLTVIICSLRALDLDQTLFRDDGFTITISSIFLAFVVLVIARFLDWYSKVLLHRYYVRRNEAPLKPIKDGREAESKASRIVQFILYTIVGIVLIRGFDLNYSLFQINGEDETFDFRITSILSVLLILLMGRLIAWILTQLVLYSYYRQRKIDPGRGFAVNRLITYFIYVLAIFLAIDNIGIEMTVLWGGIAALLVGIGLGLQEIFRDLVSGIILLFERTAEVGDIVDLGSGPGRIAKIGLRTSLMQTRDDTMAIVPNSKLVSSGVVNWTHSNRKARFSLKVGVAYGSDPRLVRKLLLQAAQNHPLVERHSSPFVRFIDFADSALLFELFFWSRALMNIDDVKSDLRFEINDLIVSSGISIPFPQVDVHLKPPTSNPDR